MKECTSNYLAEGGELVACGLQQTFHFTTLAKGGRVACTERGWVSSTPLGGAADPCLCARYYYNV